MNTKKGFFTSSNRYGIPDIKKEATVAIRTHGLIKKRINKEIVY